MLEKTKFRSTAALRSSFYAPATIVTPVYTIGAYEECLKNNAEVHKFGPMHANEVPEWMPKSFLEKDGSYGGGEVFRTIKEAQLTLEKQICSKMLPEGMDFYIYLLEADWTRDVCELHPNDFRLKTTVLVLKKVEFDPIQNPTITYPK